MYLKFNQYILCLLISLLGQYSLAQKVHFRNYTNKEGLPQNSVLYITQDSEGYLWLATQVGVARFDGKTFHNYSISEGLPDNIVNYILEDSKKRIWIATEGGVSRFEHDKFITVNKDKGLLENPVSSLSEDSYGNIWCVTRNGISVISNDTVVFNLTTSTGLPSNTIQRIFRDSKGRMWIATLSGAACYDRGKLRTITNELNYNYSGKIEKIVWAFAEDHAGRIWIATQGGGVFVFKDFVFEKRYTTLDGLGDNTILTMFRDKAGNIWFGQLGNGISCFDGKKITSYAKDLLPDDAVQEILEDNLGQIWCRTFQSGVLYGHPGSFRKVTSDNNLIYNKVQDLYLDSFGNVWIGTIVGASMMGKGIFEEYTTSEGLPDNNIVSVLSEKDGTILSGTYSNLAYIKRGKVLKIYGNANYSDSVSTILSLFQDNKDQIWLGSFKSLVKFNGSQFNRVELNRKDRELYSNDNGIFNISQGAGDSLLIATENGAFTFNKKTGKYFRDPVLAQKIVRCSWKSPSGSVWYTTTNGVFVKTPSKYYHFTMEDGLPDLVCYGISSDLHGKVWVGTQGGLAQFSDSAGIVKLTRIYTKKDGLAGNTIFSVLFDGKESVWVGNEKGLNRILLTSGKILYYGVLDGFTPLESNTNAISMDASGQIWFGTVAGLVVYKPKFDSISKDPPKTYITNLKFSDNSFNILNYCDSLSSDKRLPVQLKLPYNYNTFTIECIGIHLTIPEKVKYQYFLEGYDDNWSEPSSLTYYECKKLPPGHYTFRVKACNNDGIWTTNPVFFSFQVKPPFYRTVWAYLVYILVIILVFFGYIRYRERKLQHDKRVLEAEVKKRTAEIERQKEEIQQINVELREQQQEILAQRDEIERQRDIATQQRDQISLQKKEMTDSIHYAKRIQNAILPSEEFARSIMPEHFILFKPRDIVSGDFYWMTRKDEKLVIVAADCTGHGVPGAFMSMLGVSLLNEIINKEDIFIASEILNKLRENVKLTLSQTGKDNEAKDGMDIALCVIDFRNNILQYSGANNPFYLIRNKELIEYKADGMPIGIYVGEEKMFTNNRIELQSGDVGYIFSDGYADQFGGPTGGKFKTKPFKRLILQEHDKPMTAQKQDFDSTLENWKAHLDQVDDILVIGFRIP
jgi:ligand-binding sensor domain-containing protein/serine phosphatase RsbU (regulator of sigma subunit)